MTAKRPPHSAPENRPRKVAICVGSGNRYMDQIVAGIARFTGDHRRWQFYLDYLGDITDTSLADGFECDGVIAWTPRRPALVQSLKQIKVPVVDLSREVEDLTFPRVVPDDIAVGRLVADHFLARGYRNFAFCGNPGKYWSDEREAGFRSAVGQAGYSCTSYTGPDAFIDHHNAREQNDIGQWLKGLPKPLALMAGTDRRGRHVLINCRQAGLMVPEEVAIIAVDNIPALCEMVRPQLSSVPLDGYAVGFNAAAMLEQLMEGNAIENQMVQVPPLPIIERRSSDAFAVSDPDVVAAMRFIWNRAGVFTCVEDVLKNAAVSLRTLQLQFRKSLGRTIQQEIWRIHVERAKTLLGESTLSVAEIAEASGFRSAQSLSEIFRRQVGTSPTDYRRRIRPKG